MNFYEKIDDLRAQSGIGAALYVKEEGSGKYRFLIPLASVPLMLGAPESFEYNITTSPTKGKVQGKLELDDVDFEFLAHRDNFRRLDEVKGKALPYLVINSDYTGWKYIATLSYKQESPTASDIAKATGTLIGTSAEVDPIEDVMPLLMPTVKIASKVPSAVVAETATGKVEFTVETLPTAATITVTSNQTGGFTAAATDKKVTITGTNASTTAAVTGVVYIKAALTDYAPWTTTVHVTIPAATGG